VPAHATLKRKHGRDAWQRKSIRFRSGDNPIQKNDHFFRIFGHFCQKMAIFAIFAKKPENAIFPKNVTPHALKGAQVPVQVRSKSATPPH
jgi:hypothetical protein